jgi:general secretion pathway protein G
LINCLNRKAFTLLEIIFVVVILGIIASVAVSKLDFTKDDAKIVAVKEDIRVIVDSTKSHFIINDSLDKFSTILTLNPDIWTVADKSLVFNSGGSECVKIELTTNSGNDILKITTSSTNEDNSCKKLLESVSSVSYTLNGN